jgi:hypothetical protein
MAFQFSGTALDVAIQQREQAGEEPLTQSTTEKSASAESPRVAHPPSETQSNQPDKIEPADISPVSSVVDAEKLPPPPPLPVNLKSEIIEKLQPSGSVRLLPAKKSRHPARVGVNPDLQAFIDRWKPFLTETQIGICTYIYNNSTTINQEYCFTSTAKLMTAVSKTERQVKTVLNQLIDWEFLLKGETVVNAPREKRGTFYKLNLDKY